MPDLSIVIPVYNEEECLPLLFEALDAFLEDFVQTCEVILVDDGSRDASMQVMLDGLRGRPSYRVVQLRANCGQTGAMAAGLRVAAGNVIVFMDADLQNDPQDIPKLLEKLDEGFDLVSGWRRDRKDRAITRTFPSRLANRLIGVVTGVRLHDYGCSLKAYRARVVKPLTLYSDMHRFLPALCSRTGARVTEIVVRHHPRLLGSSKYGLDRIFKVLVDLVVIKLIVAFADRPMHYFGLASIGFLAVGFGSAALWLANLSSEEASIVYPSILLLSVSGFLYFLFVGLLSELIVQSGRQQPSELARAGMVEVD